MTEPQINAKDSVRLETIIRFIVGKTGWTHQLFRPLSNENLKSLPKNKSSLSSDAFHDLYQRHVCLFFLSIVTLD